MKGSSITSYLIKVQLTDIMALSQTIAYYVCCCLLFLQRAIYQGFFRRQGMPRKNTTGGLNTLEAEPQKWTTLNFKCQLTTILPNECIVWWYYVILAATANGIHYNVPEFYSGIELCIIYPGMRWKVHSEDEYCVTHIYFRWINFLSYYIQPTTFDVVCVSNCGMSMSALKDHWI